MTYQTARILAAALKNRNEAMEAMLALLPGDDPEVREHAETYVHEQRIINRIISEARDG